MHTRTTLPPCKTERRAGRASRARTRSPAPAAATFAVSLSVGALSTALAGPTGGVVVEGQGSISNPAIGSTVIDQGSQRLTLNWSTFNVGANESVQFNQPNSTALALNRILDQNPSQIFGSLKANGQVVLVNPNGLLIGRTAQLNVNSLVASSLDAIDFDAASGRYRFSTARNDIGAVINEGSITAGPGGSVTLLGGRVSNSGSIVADFGTVNLAAGRAATLDLAGDGLLRLEVNSDLLSNSGGTAAVENSGTIQANGGQVLLTANAVQDVFAHLVNNTGVVRANRIDNTGGTIRLLGPNGVVQSSGTLDASAGDATSTGGSVSVLGDRVGLIGTAVVDVSGATGGGTALIGGDYQGSNPDVLNATRTYVGSGITLNADAGATGDGGRIIVWSNEDTHYYGQLTARGGSLFGNGGFAEVSGKLDLDFAGGSNLTAPHGSWGTLLLDPDGINIVTGAASIPANRFTDHDWTTAEDSGSGVVDIDPAQIEGLLDSNSIALHATDDITSAAGSDIDVSGAGHGGAANKSLTLGAGGAITLDGDITLRNGDLILTSGAGKITVNGAVDTTGGNANFSTGNAVGDGIVLSNALATGGGNATLTAGGSGIDMQTGSSINAGGGTVQLTADNTIGLTTIQSSGDITIHTTAGSITNDAPNTGTRVIGDHLTLTADAGAIGSSGAGNAIDTLVNTLDATATGAIYINQSGDITLHSVQTTAGNAIASVTTTAGGDINVQDIEGNGDVLLDAAGSILQAAGGINGVNSINGGVSLHAQGAIGSLSPVDDPLRIFNAGTLVARSEDSTNGTINLQLRSGIAPTVSAGGIRLGNTATRSGTIKLQSTGNLNAQNFAGNAFTLGSATNQIVIDFDAGGTMTLPGASFTDQPASQMNLHGTDIFGPGASNTLTLVAKSLFFDATNPAAGKTLNTQVEKLDVDFGVARNLTVSDSNATGALTLGSINAGGAVDIQSTTGGLFDDNASPTTTYVTGTSVKLKGATLGTFGNQIDTDTNSLDLQSTNGGDTYVVEKDAVTVTAASAAGALSIATQDGAMTIANPISGQGVTLATNGAGPRNLTINGSINGGGGPVVLQTNPAGSSISLGVGAPVSSSGDVTLTAGSGGTITSNSKISANHLHMTAASIGTVGTPISTAATSLITNSTTGTFIAEDDGVDVDAQATAGQINIQTTDGSMTVTRALGAGVALTSNGAGRSIAVNGPVNGNGSTVGLTTAANGSIVINGTVNAAGAISLTTGANGNIDVNDDVTSSNNDVTLTAGTAIGGWGAINSAAGAVSSGRSVTAEGASIGTSGTVRFNTDANPNTLTLTSHGGNIFAQESGAAALTANAIGGGALDVAASGALTVNSASGTGVKLVTTGGTGNMVLNGAINGNASAVVLTASQAVSGAGPVTGGSLNVSGTSIGTSLTRLATTVGALTTSSTGVGGTFVTESDGATLNGTATGGGTLDVASTTGTLDVTSASGNGVTLDAAGAGALLRLTGAVAGNGSAVNLRASGNGGNVELDSTVDAGAGAVTVTAGSVAARGTLTLGAGNHVTGGAVNVTAQSVGASAQRLNTDATSLTATSTAVGGTVFVQEDNAITSLTVSADGALNVAAGGNVGVASAIGNGVTLTTTGSGNIGVNGAIAGGANGVTLAAGGAVTSGGGTVTGDSLTASGTAIGASGARLATNVNALNTTSAGAGGTFITEADGATLTGSATGGGALDVLVTAGSLTVSSATGNGVSLVAGGAGNTLTVSGAVAGGAGPVTLSASGANGNVDLQNTVSTTGNVSVTAGTGGARGNLLLNPATTIAGNAVTVAAQSIGTSGSRLKTAATSLNATSSVGDIYVDQTGALTTLTANAAGAVDVIGNGALGSSGGSVTGTSFTANATSIGSSANRLATNVATLNTTSTGAGGTFITEADSVTLTGNATGGGALDVQTTAGTLSAASINGNGIRLVAGGAGSNLDVSSAVTGGTSDVTLAATGDNGNVNIGGSVSTTGDVTITAGSVADRGVITLGGGAGTVNGDDVVVAAESIGTLGGPLVTTARTLTATTSNGGIFVRDTDGLELTANATGGTIAAETQSGELVVHGAAGDGISLTSAGTGITVDGAVDGRAGAVALNAQADGATIALSSTLTTAADVLLTAGSVASRGGITAGAGNQVNANGLVAVGASIGTANARLNTAVSAMDLTSTNGGAFVTESNGLTLTGNATGGVLDVQTNGGVLNVNGVTGNGVALVAGGAGNDLNINGSVSGGAGDVALSAAGAGGSIHLDAPVTTSGNVTLTAGTAGNRGAIAAGAGGQISGNGLTATGASVGTSSARLATTVSSLNATSTNGGTFVTESDGLSLTANATGGAVDVATTNGALTVAAASGNGVSLVANGDGNELSVTGPVSGGASGVTLLANGAGSNLRLAGAISTTANVTLTAGTGASRGAIITEAGNGVAADVLTAVGTSIGTSTVALNTTVNTLDATATAGNIRIAETNDLAITAHATGGSVEARTLGSRIDVAAITAEGVDLEAGGSGPLNVNGPINAGGGAVTLDSGGAIALNGDVTTTGGMGLTSGAGSNITLNAALSGGNVAINAGTVGNAGDLVIGTNGHITADALSIRSASVGSSTTRLATTANSLNATALNGGVFVDDADALDLTASATGAVDVATTNGALTVTGASGSSVTLTAGGADNGLVVNGAINAGTGNVMLNAGASASRGAITGGAGNHVAGNTVSLIGSSIGASNARINTDVATLNATSTNGGIFLNELNALTLNANANGGALDVNAGGVLTVHAASGTGVALTTAAGTIDVNSLINGGTGPVTLTAGGAGSGIAFTTGVFTTGNVTLTAGTTTSRGAITADDPIGITGASLTVAGSSIGSTTNRLNTTVASLDATSTNGGTFVTETDGLTLNASATGGTLDVQTTNGALTVTGAAGSTVALSAGGAGSSIAVNGAINAGTGDVALTAGTTASRGAITGTAAGRVSGGTLTALASSIGSTAAPLNTTIDSLNANASNGDIAISEQNGVRLTDVRAGGSVSVSSASGDITVDVVNATNNATLTASGGAIADDGDDTTRLLARDVTLLARSIGGPSTLTGTVLDSKPRLDISATTLDATATGGGVYVDELDGLTRVSAHAAGGAAGNIELLSATGDLNLQSIGASGSLLLSAGRDIVALPGLGTISAQAAELRAGGADATAGHIGSLSQPLNLQLTAGNTLRLFVPNTVSPKDASRAPSTLPSPGVLTTLSLFGAPNALSVQAGFGQFTGSGDTQFTSPAESLVRTIQNQTAVTQSVVGLDWASFDPNVSLFGTLDPAVCLPSDQRDEEKGDAGC